MGVGAVAVGYMKNLWIALHDREEVLGELRRSDATPLETAAAWHIQELIEINDSLAATIILKDEQIKRLQEERPSQ